MLRTPDGHGRRGAQLVGEVVQYKNAYRLCCVRGPEGLLIGLAQELSWCSTVRRQRPAGLTGFHARARCF